MLDHWTWGQVVDHVQHRVSMYVAHPVYRHPCYMPCTLLDWSWWPAQFLVFYLATFTTSCIHLKQHNTFWFNSYRSFPIASIDYVRFSLKDMIDSKSSETEEPMLIWMWHFSAAGNHSSKLTGEGGDSLGLFQVFMADNYLWRWIVPFLLPANYVIHDKYIDSSLTVWVLYRWVNKRQSQT